MSRPGLRHGRLGLSFPCCKKTKDQRWTQKLCTWFFASRVPKIVSSMSQPGPRHRAESFKEHYLVSPSLSWPWGIGSKDVSAPAMAPKKRVKRKSKDQRPAKRLPTAKPKPSSQNQGVKDITAITEVAFSLQNFAQEQMKVLNVIPVSGKQLKLGTACSGAGAPSLTLQHLVEFSEIIACEIDLSAAHALLTNCSPLHCHKDVLAQAENKKCFCSCCGKTCRVPTADHAMDLFVCGWPCNSNSVLSPVRFEKDPTETDHADVLRGVADLLAKYKPRAFVLENVVGMCKKRTTSDDRTVSQWVRDVLMEKVPDYLIQEFILPSWPLPAAQFFWNTNSCFVSNPCHFV